MTLRKVAASALFCAGMTCISGYAEQMVVDNAFDPAIYETELAAIDKDAYEWGVALSGGGLRSSLFAYGAMKALYDLGILENIDVISSVSGGGYTAFSLVTTKHQGKFGSAFFSGSEIYQQTCELITRGNFVTVPNALGAALSLNPRKKSIELYENAIARTYGRGELAGYEMDALLASVKTGENPFWIVNTTLIRSNNALEVYEFTPYWNGNDLLDYVTWENEAISVNKAVAISGAAFAPLLKQTLQTSNANAPDGKILLSDGGHSENLGALALIKRGVSNIIIVDAEHDPQYKFGAVRKLRDHLSPLGLELKIDDAVGEPNGERLKTAVFQGEVIEANDASGGRKVSNIFYVKMSFPESMDSLFEDEEELKRGEMAHKQYFETLEAGKDVDGNWNCGDVRNIQLDLAAWTKYNIGSYSNYLHSRSYVDAIDLPGDFFTAKFPQYTTVDQSFYLDQALAFIGIGYFEALELKRMLDAVPN